jgi:hypothetical protein
MGLILDINRIVERITLETQEKAAKLKGKENRTFRQILEEELEKNKRELQNCLQK